MNERAAAQAFEKEIAVVLPGAPGPVHAFGSDLDESTQIAAQLRALASEWGRQTSPRLQQEVASLAERAEGRVERAATGRFARKRMLRVGVVLAAAATLLIAVIPAAREAVARQLYRVLDVFVVGPHTEVVRPDENTRAEISATLEQFDRQLSSGRRWHFSTGYGVGFGGSVPTGASPALQRVDRLDVLRSLTSMAIQHPTARHRGTIPTFSHAMLAPDGLLLLFFGSSNNEILLVQAPVGGGRSMSHSRVVCCSDEPGKPNQYSPPLKTEELLLDGQTVVWDPDNTGLIPDSSALRWEREGVSYSLLGRALTRDEAIELFLSLRPWGAQPR